MRYTIPLIALLTVVLAGCGTFTAVSEIIEDEVVTRSLQYFSEGEMGPVYDVSVTVPSNWVGRFQTDTTPNKITFLHVSENGAETPVFYIEALSQMQYWEQNGSYPGVFYNIGNRIDTYFIYYMSINSNASGLTTEQYEAFAAEVSAIAATFESELAGGDPALMD
jgi:hypothetical protein